MFWNNQWYHLYTMKTIVRKSIFERIGPKQKYKEFFFGRNFFDKFKIKIISPFFVA